MQEHIAASAAKRPGLLARVDAWLQERQSRALEAWLGTSQNVAELEARMRALNDGTPHPFY
jgi:hypothetical protein